MVDITKQIAYWRDNVKEDWEMEVLAEINAFHIEGRYPESLTKAPTTEARREGEVVTIS